MLDGPDGVEGDGRRGDDGAPGLGGDPRGRVDTRLGARAAGGLGPLGLGGRRLAVDVGDAEPAADHELGQPERGEERTQHLSRPFEGGRVEDLAPDVRVHPHQLDGRHELERGDGLGRRSRGDREAELGVLLPGADVLVGVGLDPRGDADEDLGPLHRRRR